jgi:hypothetical protein
MNMESVFTQTYDIKDNMVDCQGYLKPSQILFIAQDMGGRHCKELTLSYDDMAARGLFWAVSRHRVQITRLPMSGETIRVETWAMPATAAVVIQAGEEEMRRAGFGAGPIDATFNVISQIVSRAPDLEQFSINAITGGTDAQGEVTVRLREGEYSATGRGSDPDIIVASAKAYIDALNRLDHKERDALRTQEATGEPAINTCN